MPIDHRLDVERRLVFVVMTGEVTPEEFRAYEDALEASPGYHRSFARLVDCRGVTRLPTEVEARAIGAVVRASGDPATPSRRAWVVASPFAYGVARQIQSYGAGAGVDGMPFLEMGAARGWLGLPTVESPGDAR